MTDPILTIADITPLSVKHWETARKQAKAAILGRYPMPQRRDFEQRVFNKYPNWLTGGMAAGLVILGVAAFIISAGKLIVSADLTLAPVLRDTNRLGAAWLDLVIILSLIFGEIGTALFMLASAIFPGSSITIRGRSFSPAQVIFRGSAILCAGLAIAGNVGVSATHTRDFAQVGLFGWGLTILPPSIVIVVSLLGEKMVLAAIDARADAEVAYLQGMKTWESLQADPETHPEYKESFYLAILEQLEKVSKRNRERIQALISEDPQVRIELVSREMQRHLWTRWVVEDQPGRPTLPAESGVMGTNENPLASTLILFPSQPRSVTP